MFTSFHIKLKTSINEKINLVRHCEISVRPYGEAKYLIIVDYIMTYDVK